MRNFFLLLVISLFVLPVSRISAQQGSGQFTIARTLTVADNQAVSGDIMSLNDDGSLVRTAKTSDERTYGVLVEKPLVVFRTQQDIPIVRFGEATVNVTNLNGPLKVGDYVAASPIAGKGQKPVDASGYMVGLALENWDGTSGGQIEYNGKQYVLGSIKVAVGVGPASPAVIKAQGGPLGTLQQIVQGVMFNINTSRQFERMVRIILAILVALLIIYICLRTFGRNITKGIEAIGRNPLAKVSIQSMIIVNVVLIAIVSIAGVVLSLVIISL